ncbi:MAG: tetratricopeptide repeat protein [Myxococcota bacterium]
MFLSATAHAEPASAASAGTKGSESDDARIRALVRRGETLYESGQTAQARQPLLEAWALRQSYDVATMLGQVEQDLGHDAEAATYYDFALRNFAPTESEEALKGLKARLADVAAKVTAVDVRVNKENAEISVDGRVVGKSPLPARVFLSPGEHVVVATWEGQGQQAPVVGKPGEERAVSLSFVDLPPESSTPNPSPAPTSSASGPALAPLLVGGAVVAIGLGVGIGEAISAGNQADDLRSLRSQTGPGACVNPSEPTLVQLCSSQREVAERYDRDRNWSTAGFVVAGAAAIATATYWLWPRDSAESSSSGRSLRIAPTAGLGVTGLVFSGDFK